MRVTEAKFTTNAVRPAWKLTYEPMEPMEGPHAGGCLEFYPDSDERGMLFRRGLEHAGVVDPATLQGRVVRVEWHPAHDPTGTPWPIPVPVAVVGV